MIEIKDGISIGEEELVFRASRSGGPGGQNVNKVNSRVTLFFDVSKCEALSDLEKRRILSRLSSRADKKGVLRVVCQRFRTQGANREGAVAKFRELVAEALRTRAARKPTKVPYGAVRRRLEDKRRRSMLKSQRSRSRGGEDIVD